jgi:hypothetical protein
MGKYFNLFFSVLCIIVSGALYWSFTYLNAGVEGVDV